MVQNIQLWWWDNLVWLGSGLMFCNVGWCGVDMLIRILLVVCKIMSEDSDSTLEYKRWFKGGGWTGYKERWFCVVWFPFLHCLLIHFYSTARDNFEQFQLLSCHVFLIHTSSSLSWSDITWLVPLSPAPDPTHFKIPKTNTLFIELSTAVQPLSVLLFFPHLSQDLTS
jgi:hypothetical protein